MSLDLILALYVQTGAVFFAYGIPFIVLISGLVLIHEWGHYKAARLIGIQVDQFSVGFGPALFRHKDANGCEWRVGILPLGGYVKFFGDTNAASATTSPGADVPEDPAMRRRQFRLRSPLDKSFVILAGPIINLVFGIAIGASVYVFNGEVLHDPVVSAVTQGMPAEQAGMRAGDRVLSIDGAPVASYEDIRSIIMLAVSKPVTIDVERGIAGTQSILHFEMTTQVATIETLGIAQEIGVIGIATVEEAKITQVSPWNAILLSTRDIVRYTRTILTVIPQLFSGERPLDAVAGPVKMAEMSGNAAQIGPYSFLILMGFISVSLGIMNLLPIPMLDGGQLVICLIEGIARRNLPYRVVTAINYFGAGMLILLMAVVSINDIVGIL